MSGVRQAEEPGSARTTDLVEVQGLVKTFPQRNAWGRTVGTTRAVDGIDLTIRRGETLALVGESGSGKSTLGRCILQMDEPTSGTVTYEGVDLTGLPRAKRAPYHRSMQVIFQDPFSSLNPHRTALQNVMEPLTVLAPDSDPRSRAIEALAAVGIDGDAVNRRPRAFSGGQRQRIVIARAIAVRPGFVVCDEPLSALDMSIQAQVTDLLLRLQRELELTYLFISHDLSVVREIATRTAVMNRGRIVELGPTAEVFASPQHPYTRHLLDAALSTDPAQARRRLERISTRPEPVGLEPDGTALAEVAPGHFVLR
ncbi:ABC-type oligopeptide transport system ATPase subunit [Microbacterium trichothecenolyticum]|uniref:ATP-binding cassette domain-containing protein n=1 Tax=Microbacterium trichothecenolyticum TaxID=69370 RepID=UPI00285B50FA|nr:ATP-binding cassette domain-containing protein [Microbacterium trichothecenolyticum]MDR7185288.1 ABC-type oligopeptide transport system ATPase subunit [Microbacterium trichothecenolyticum]